MDNTYLENLKYYQLKNVFDKYLDVLRETEYLCDKTAAWNEKEGTINVIVIRCNDIYITNDMNRNNDWLIILENRPEDSFRKYIFKCTADPKIRRNEIANICEQIYTGNIRPHRWISGRDAICQDNCRLWVQRFKNNNSYREFGHFGINIHNSDGFANSSLGCVILASENDYINNFRPLLRRVEKNHIPIVVIRDKKFEEYAQ